MHCNQANDDEPSRLIGRDTHSRTSTGENTLLGGQGATVPVRLWEAASNRVTLCRMRHFAGKCAIRTAFEFRPSARLFEPLLRYRPYSNQELCDRPTDPFRRFIKSKILI